VSATYKCDRCGKHGKRAHLKLLRVAEADGGFPQRSLAHLCGRCLKDLRMNWLWTFVSAPETDEE